jgi:hypothetical protein
MIAYISHKRNKTSIEICDKNKHITVPCTDEDKVCELLNTLQSSSEFVQIATQGTGRYNDYQVFG